MDILRPGLSIALVPCCFLQSAIQSFSNEEVPIAVVGGRTFGHAAFFGKGLVAEECSFTVQTTGGNIHCD